MKQLTEVQKAYLAGVIDGEGSISCGISNQCLPQLFVSVGMLHEALPKILHEAFGGTLSRVTNHTTSTGTNWQWQVNGGSCKGVLEAIKPYAVEKRAQVLLALEFITTIKPRSQRQQKLTAREFVYKHRLAELLRNKSR